MNAFSISSTHPKNSNKHSRLSGLLSTDQSRFSKESKTSDQYQSIGQKENHSECDSNQPLGNSTRFEMENYFEQIIEKMSVLPLHSSFEPILTSIYSSFKSILWILKDPHTFSYYSPTVDLWIKGEDTLLTAASRAKTSIVCPPAMNILQEDGKKDQISQNFENLESECHKMFFPLYLKTGNIVAVAEILRTSSQSPFEDRDLKISSFIMKKFLLYGSVVFKPSETVLFASEFSNVTSPKNLYRQLSSALLRSFHCKIAEFWCHFSGGSDFLKLDSESGEFSVLPRASVGVVIAAIRAKSSISAKAPRYHPNFSFSGDPLPDEPILVSTHEVDDIIFAVVLRGKKQESAFSQEEVAKLESVLPFISQSLLFSIDIKKKKGVTKRDPAVVQLSDILDAEAAFSGQTDFDALVGEIQDRSKNLVKAQSCAFILHDHLSHQFLLMDNNLAKLNGNIGLAGNVASFGDPIRSSSPTSDARFDKRVDFEIHQVKEVESLLIVPVFSPLNNIVGIISLANKIKNRGFSEEDEVTMVTIASLASISLKNSNIFRSSIELTRILNDFVHIKNEKNENEKLSKNDSILVKVLKKAKDESKADRVTLFLCNEKSGSLLTYRSIGGPPEQGTKYSSICVQQRKQVSFPINDDFTERKIGYQPQTEPLKTVPSKSSSKPEKGSNSNKVDTGTSPSPSQTGKLICCTPIYFQRSEIIGVVEIVVNSIETAEEVDIFQQFCNIVSMSISKESIDEIEKNRNEQFALIDSIPEAERDLFNVPSAFKENVPENIFSIDFDITLVDTKYSFNLIFAIFNKFGLMHEFCISASKLFLFIYRIKKLYNDDKKLFESIENTCYLSYLLLSTKFDVKLERYELLSLIVSSLCRNVSPASVQNPNIDFLYSKQPAFESISCAELFSLLSSSESNLFENLDDEKIYLSKELIIQLFLSTDYYKHNSILHEFKVLVSSGVDCFEKNSKDKLLVMKMFLKCSLVGVIGRVPIVADKYQDIVCDEFFSRGPIEKTGDIAYSSTVKDRFHVDKKKSKKSVLDSVFSPMFKLMVKLFPQLDETFNYMSDNVARWSGRPRSSNSPRQVLTPTSSRASVLSIDKDKDKLGPDRMLEKE